MKRLLVIAVLLFMGNLIFAQLPVTFGPKIGYTSTELTTDKSEIKNDLKSGFLAGAFVRIKGKKIYFQPEVYFAAKGGDLNYDLNLADTVSPVSVSKTISLNTVDIPLILGYKLFDAKVFNFRIHAGPVASFVVNKDFEIKHNGEDPETEVGEGEDQTIKDAIWGLQAGAGIDVLMFTLDVRYEIGLNNIYEKQEGEPDSGLSEYKSNVFMVTLGWKIL